VTVRVQAAPPAHHPWLAKRAGLSLHSGFMALEAVEDGLAVCDLCKGLHGRILGMVGYDGWLPGAVCLHVAVEHPAALRHLLRPGFGVVFDAPPRGFGKVAAIATVLSTNERSIRLVAKLGFRHIYTGRDWCGTGVDFEVFEMRREDCRFIPRAMRRAA
jgi:hypothetical protein